MTGDYLDQLNDQQREAVIYTDGPQLVIAGAGSGKTRVLTYKIVHLINLGYEPWRIMALTFTNKAAKEMRERIQAIVGPSVAAKLWMGTFHSIFLRLLRIHAERIGFKSNFTIYDAADSKSLIKTIIKDMDLDDKLYKPSTIASIISSAKNAMISPDGYERDRDLMEADRRARRPMTHTIYRAYVNRCFAASAMDFDDILYFTNLLLRDNPDILRHYQSYFRYILIDEYQDTNFAQHLIATMLCSESQKFCAVGDDAQSIYSFRGANICNILNLRTTYPTLQTFKLEQNYRSTQNIINAANSLIAKNKEQIHKNIFSLNSVGSPIEITQSYSDYEEAVLVANQIANLHHSQHDDYDHYAILYRTNAQARRLEEQLRNRNIPYRIWGGMSFFQYKEVKDLIAYMRLTVNPDDDEALRRIINYPTRGIGETTVKKLVRTAIDSNSSIWNILTHIEEYDTGLASASLKKVVAFRDLIQGLINFNAANSDDAESIVREILTHSKLISMFETDKTPENVARQQNIQEVLSGVHEFVEMRREEGEEKTSLADFLGHISLATDQDQAGETTPQVTLMTVHASKGLEFDNVFITGVEEELFPSAMSRDSI
ncbi:MAG: UvrD-helicase domain-containing protein, partial [Muribaculum sp.]|nr:UvrD-helicase domain-containing protein [Muribaculum sp.]